MLDMNTKSTRLSGHEWSESRVNNAHCHDSLESARLPAAGPSDALEAIITPQVLYEEYLKL